MPMYFAQLDSDNIVVSISQSERAIEGDHIVEIQDYDLSILKKKWNGSVFEEVIEEVPNIVPMREFANRFTKEEMMDAHNKALEFPLFQAFLDELNVSDSVNLDDQTFIQKMNIFVQNKVVTQERLQEILT